MSHASTVSASDSLSANDLETSLFGDPPADPSVKFAAAMIMAMLDSGEGISDLVFSPRRPPQVEKHGRLTAVGLPQGPTLQQEETTRVGRGVIDGNRAALPTLPWHGASRLSHSI